MSGDRQYYEEIEVGSTRNHGNGRVVTAEEIKRFALEFDPMPFHTDEKAAKDSILGGLCASSVHVLALGSQLAHAPERAPWGLLVRMLNMGGMENAACFSYPAAAYPSSYHP